MNANVPNILSSHPPVVNVNAVDSAQQQSHLENEANEDDSLLFDFAERQSHNNVDMHHAHMHTAPDQ